MWYKLSITVCTFSSRSCLLSPRQQNSSLKLNPKLHTHRFSDFETCSLLECEFVRLSWHITLEHQIQGTFHEFTLLQIFLRDERREGWNFWPHTECKQMFALELTCLYFHLRVFAAKYNFFQATTLILSILTSCSKYPCFSSILFPSSSSKGYGMLLNMWLKTTYSFTNETYLYRQKMHPKPSQTCTCS